MDTKDKGSKCESQVAEYLISHGHRIICRNYRCPFGELDIISLCDRVLCITEVKSLTSRWDADEIRYMVPPSKLAKMRKALRSFLVGSKVDGFDTIRFDVASVTNGRVEYYRGDE